MSDRRVKNEQWYIKDLIQKIERKDIHKPKFQRKKKWDIQPKRENIPSEQKYIEFLGKTYHSADPISCGISNYEGRIIYKNIDGNNRLNTIAHFMKSPFEIFPCYLDDLYKILGECNLSEPVEKEIYDVFESITYQDLLSIKWTSEYFEFVGKTELYDKYLNSRNRDIEKEIGKIQKKLMINNRDRYDTDVIITMNIFEGYGMGELNDIYNDINKYKGNFSELESLSSLLFEINDFTIKDDEILAAIKNKIKQYYKEKSEEEVLECFDYNGCDEMNAYDFIVGFQNYCNSKFNFIEKVQNGGLTLFFKIYKLVYNGIDTETFTTPNVNDFIEKINYSCDLLNEIKDQVFTDKLNDKLFANSCKDKLGTLKTNNYYLLICSLIGFYNKKEKKENIINSFEKCILYHFFISDVVDKEKRDYFKQKDAITYKAGGGVIDSDTRTYLKNPSKLSKMNKELFIELIEYLYKENNKPHERYLPTGKYKNEKRRPRKFYEKTLMFYYYKKKMPVEMLENEFSIEHIFPNSSIWEDKLDIDRFGNVIPIINSINTKRGNRHISKYQEIDTDGFIKFIDDIIPKHKIYNKIISHNEKKPKITSNKVYNLLCERNEKIYLDNFIKCIF